MPKMLHRAAIKFVQSTVCLQGDRLNVRQAIGHDLVKNKIFEAENSFRLPKKEFFTEQVEGTYCNNTKFAKAISGVPFVGPRWWMEQKEPTPSPPPPPILPPPPPIRMKIPAPIPQPIPIPVPIAKPVSISKQRRLPIPRKRSLPKQALPPSGTGVSRTKFLRCESCSIC